MIAKRPFVDGYSFSQTIKLVYPVFNIFLFPSMIPNPSSMNLWKIVGHFNFLSWMHFFFSSSCNIAKYKLAKMGARLVPMIIPKICWKYSLSNLIRLFFSTMFSSSITKCAFGMTFWNWNTSFFMSSIASDTGMFVYKLSKSTVKRKKLN